MVVDTKRSKLVIGKNDHWIIAAIVAVFLLVIFSLAISSCIAPSRSSSASAQTRQAEAVADREEELQYRDESGQMDWRARIDAAKETLEQAQSTERWGQPGEALEQALDAARMMPPPGKDFDLQNELAGGGGEPQDASGDSNADPDAAEAPKINGVTNAEVEEMRTELEELLERLEGSAAGSSGSLSLDSDLIEIQ